MTPDHGTRARYLRGCRCDDCGAAHRRYCKRYKHLTACRRRDGGTEGPTRPLRVDAEPVAAHVGALIASGLTVPQIARDAGIPDTTVYCVARRRYPTVAPGTARALMDVDPLPAPDPDYVDPVVVERLIDGADWREIGATRAERIAAAEYLHERWAVARESQRLRGTVDGALPGVATGSIERHLGLRSGRDFARKGATA
jgi:hypothetical protein